MSPKLKVVLGLGACIVATVVTFIAFASIAGHFGIRMGTGHGSGEDFALLEILSVLLPFIVGAVAMRRTFRAATKTGGGAVLLAAAFATFPIWFLPAAFSLAFTIALMVQTARRPAPDISLNLLTARHAEHGSEVTITMTLHPVVRRRIKAFDLDVRATYPWSVDLDSPHRGHVTAMREGNKFKYQETESHEALLTSPSGSVSVPVVI
ncbi:MAG TPA: hypothetical protein VF505_04200, partial [Thermoanaerobaculia bacterium]